MALPQGVVIKTSNERMIEAVSQTVIIAGGVMLAHGLMNLTTSLVNYIRSPKKELAAPAPVTKAS